MLQVWKVEDDMFTTEDENPDFAHTWGRRVSTIRFDFDCVCSGKSVGGSQSTCTSHAAKASLTHAHEHAHTHTGATYGVLAVRGHSMRSAGLDVTSCMSVSVSVSVS